MHRNQSLLKPQLSLPTPQYQSLLTDKTLDIALPRRFVFGCFYGISQLHDHLPALDAENSKISQKQRGHFAQ
jgi:hypothetical protein